MAGVKAPKFQVVNEFLLVSNEQQGTKSSNNCERVSVRESSLRADTTKLNLWKADTDSYVSNALSTKTVSARAKTQLQRASCLHSIHLEQVNGITLSAWPKGAQEHQFELSIPEIAAQELQALPVRDINIEDKIVSQRDRHSASPPPPIGARHDYVRRISPRPVSLGDARVLPIVFYTTAER